jgi:hypothetical protein
MVYFQTESPTWGKNLEGLGMENVVIFYDHWDYFSFIWYDLNPFGIFFALWYVWAKKNLATLTLMTNISQFSFGELQLQACFT